MANSIKTLIQNRKSTRTFDGIPLNEEDRDAIELYSQTLSNPFEIPLEFRILDAKKHNLTSPVLAGATLYLAAKTPIMPNYEIGFGYSFEQACLFAESMGIGTCIIAGTMNRSNFEKAMELKANESLPCISPIGYPAKKRSLKETLMRKGVKADDRIPFEKLFFDRTFDHPLDDGGIFQDALEAVRWAPSAVNKQPWRILVTGNTVHFYEQKTLKGSDPDIQKIDIGIAMCHFDMTLQEAGHFGKFFLDNPGIPTPSNTNYIASYQID